MTQMMIKLEKILFYLLVFCLPFETRTILYQWTADFNEWSSAFLYFTDLLIIGIFFLWFWRFRKERFFAESRGLTDIIRNKKIEVILILFFIAAFVSLGQAGNIQLGFYQLIKLLEFILIFFYIRHNFKNLFNFEKLSRIFIASGLLQSIIAISQYAKQASLGWRWLGESPLASDIIGAAKITVNGIKMIRAYGTFPHPNLLAVFLLAVLFFLYFLWLKDKIHYGPLTGIFGLLSFAFFLTFSRAAAAVFFTASLLCFILFFGKNKKKILYLFLLFVVFCSIFALFAWPELSPRIFSFSEDEAVSLRVFYNKTAFLIIKNYPWLGLGLGNFVWEIEQIFSLFPSWLYQPVHNIYLLIASEVGLVGLALFLLFLYFSYSQIRGPARLNFHKVKTLAGETFNSQILVILFFSFLVLGLFDHFFWTLQQGQLMFWILLGLISKTKLIRLSKEDIL